VNGTDASAKPAAWRVARALDADVRSGSVGGIDTERAGLTEGAGMFELVTRT